MLLRIILNSLLILALPYLIPGIRVETFWTALLVAIFLGIVNALIRPILIILTLPVTILSLGSFILVINALLVLLVSTVVKGFNVNGFWPAFFAAIVLWLGSMFTNHLLQHKDQQTKLTGTHDV